MYSKTLLSRTPMGPARSVPTSSELSHLKKLAIIPKYWEYWYSSQVQFLILFPNIHIYINVSNELL